jgi:mannose-6-phosphate isomerase
MALWGETSGLGVQPAGRAVRLEPSMREKLWGKTHLRPWFADSPVPVGEAWFLSEQELPLLVKLIFTSERLSVQLHPDDGEDGPRGKTEMWHILEAEPGAEIALGFREPITRERLWQAARSGEIERLLNWMRVRAGETYFTPPHTVHAIGAGIVLCEIQQNSDVTYRLWDYGRPRELHLDRGAPLADLGVHPGPVADGVVCSKHFATEPVRLAAGESVTPEPQTCQMWICVGGQGKIGKEEYRQGEVWLLPDEGPQPEIRSDGGARFLRTFVPFSPLLK